MFASPNDKLMAEIEAMRKQYDESKKGLEQRFLDKVEKLQRGDELPPGVMKMVKVFVAVKRKIQQLVESEDARHPLSDSELMRILNRDELAGVMAHELTHVRNRDTLVQTVAATIAGAIGYIATMARYAMIFGGSSRDDDRGGAGALGALVAILVLPFVAMIIQMAISRSREYMADEGGAMVSGKPLGLASALAKLEQGAQAIPMDAAPATAHMFIVSPLTGGGLLSMFSTHPSTADRIARLQALADQGVGITSARMPRI